MPIFYSKIRCFCLFTTCSIVSFVYHIWYKFRLFTLCIHSAWGCSGACCGAVKEGQNKTVQDARPGDMQGLSAGLCINREKRRLPLGISHGRRQHITRSLIIINQSAGTGRRNRTFVYADPAGQAVPLLTSETWKIVLAGTKSPLFFLSIRSIHISAISFTG